MRRSVGKALQTATHSSPTPENLWTPASSFLFPPPPKKPSRAPPSLYPHEPPFPSPEPPSFLSAPRPVAAVVAALPPTPPVVLDTSSPAQLVYLGRKVTKEQLEAITHDSSSPLIVHAGPGTGKTHVLALRVAHFVKDLGVDPATICILSFTRKAADELRSRLQEIIGNESTKQLQLGTFHSLANSILRRNPQHTKRSSDFNVQDQDENLKTITSIVASGSRAPSSKLYLEVCDRGRYSPANILRAISEAKRTVQTPGMMREEAEWVAQVVRTYEEWEKQEMVKYAALVYEEYEAANLASDTMDFDDLVLKCAQLLKKRPRSAGIIQHLLVDELQDTNVAQFGILKHLIKNAKSVTAVGDPDQAIYSFQSARFDNFKTLADLLGERNPKTLPLSHNFRSTADLVEFGAAIINASRTSRNVFTTAPRLHPVIQRRDVHELDEADSLAEELIHLHETEPLYLSWESFAILVRAASQFAVIEFSLNRAKIPYRLSGNRFFKRREVKVALAYLELVRDDSSIAAFQALVLESYPLEEPPKVAMADYLGNRKIALQINKKTIKGLEVSRMLANVARLQKAFSEGRPLSHLLDLIQQYSLPSKSEDSAIAIRNQLDRLLQFSNYIIRRDTNLSADYGTPALLVLDSFLDEVALARASGGMLEEDNKIPKVTLSTVHAAKGLEFDVVLLPSVSDNHFPHLMSGGSAEALAEQRRLLYVAATRAKSLLYISCPLSDPSRIKGGPDSINLSPFLPAEEEAATTPYLTTRLGILRRLKAFISGHGSGKVEDGS